MSICKSKPTLNANKATAIHLAAQKNNVDCLKAIFENYSQAEKEAYVNFNMCGLTAAHLAAAHDATDALDYLLDNLGASPDIPYYPAPITKAQAGQVEPSKAQKEEGWTLLPYVLTYVHPNRVERSLSFISAGTEKQNIVHHAMRENTPLMIAFINNPTMGFKLINAWKSGKDHRPRESFLGVWRAIKERNPESYESIKDEVTELCTTKWGIRWGLTERRHEGEIAQPPSLNGIRRFAQ